MQNQGGEDEGEQDTRRERLRPVSATSAPTLSLSLSLSLFPSLSQPPLKEKERETASHIYIKEGSLGIATLRIIIVVTHEPVNLRACTSSSSEGPDPQVFEREDMGSIMHAVKRCAVLVLLVATVGHVHATENYMDYGEEMAEKSAPENIHELYRLLWQSTHRNPLNNGFGGIPLEHLMIRKSQRSPSLRLRFGRSGPHTSATGALPRPVDAMAGFDDNN